MTQLCAAEWRMKMSLVLLMVGIIILVLYVREKIRGCTLKTVFLKTAVSVVFVSIAVTAGSSAVIAPFIIMGLLFGLLGDIWLDLKYVFPKQDETFTYAGFIVFGIGHILYIAGLLVQYGARGYIAVSFCFAIVAAGLVLVLEKPMKLSYGRMRPVVLVYGFLLFSTVFVSGALLLDHRTPSLWLMFIGSVMFAVSDLILSGTFFGVGKNRPIDIICNYIFYYGGQFLIAFSVVLM